MSDSMIAMREELLDAPMATLTRRAETPEAKAFVEAVVAVLEDHETSQGTRQRKRSKAAQAGFIRAVEAFLGSLFLGAKRGKGGWVYRSRHAKSFSRQDVSYRPFIDATEAMEALGLIEIVDGFNATKTIQWDQTTTSSFQQGKAARFRATHVLIDLAARTGVEVKHTSRHFQEPKPVELVVLKDSSRWDGRDKIQGRSMAFTRIPKVNRIEEQVRLINEFLEGIDIQGGTHRGFYTVYNQGDHPSFDWDRGGRLYSVGDDSYQRDSRENRLRMTLDGEPVAELDITASYLTVLHGKLGQPLPVTEGCDPYSAVPGVPRSVVKGWLVATLSREGHLKRWPKGQEQAYQKANQQSLEEVYPIQTVREAMITQYPVLAQWGQVDVGWADLMYAEAQAIMGGMIKLIKVNQVPTLPVFDSLLVPVSQVELCKEVLTVSYKYFCRVMPRVAVNTPRIPLDLSDSSTSLTDTLLLHHYEVSLAS